MSRVNISPLSSVIPGDCIQHIRSNAPYDFIFADPPFNIGHGYEEFDDRKETLEYELWTSRWIAQCWLHLRQGGILALHGNDNLAELYLKNARSMKMRRIAWVNWHYRFGQCGRGNWIDARCHCLIFTNVPGRSYTWNHDDVLVDSDRKTVYSDPRIEDHERGGQRLPGTVWGVPSDGPYWGRIQGNNAERVPEQPNQLPEVYLERLIRAYTNTGDSVLDPFGGSGTTAVVAAALGRSVTTIDISFKTCNTIVARLIKGAVRVKGNEDAASENDDKGTQKTTSSP